jgi:RNA polymerase sigma-70 factor (ECF subfamily)
MPPASLPNLATRILDGDERAFEECYQALGPEVRRYLNCFLERGEADDVLQVVFLELWRYRHRIDPSRGIEGWLFGIARKRAIDQLRRRRHDVVDVSTMRSLVGDDGRELAERLAWAAEVRHAMSRLPDGQREAIELMYFDDLTQAQSAQQLGVPIGTLKARVSRGMHRLGQLIEEGASWQPGM